ncbi:MAG: hypothetical protein IPH43_06370 [Xanthomonadales bacterium]|nr:hypothetical protein [Xanthomonadales bacterium]
MPSARQYAGLLLCSFSAPGAIAANIVTAPQGGVARWAGMAASECGIYGKTYPAVDAVCYYPVDIQTTPGTHDCAAGSGWQAAPGFAACREGGIPAGRDGIAAGPGPLSQSIRGRDPPSR